MFRPGGWCLVTRLNKKEQVSQQPKHSSGTHQLVSKRLVKKNTKCGSVTLARSPPASFSRYGVVHGWRRRRRAAFRITARRAAPVECEDRITFAQGPGRVLLYIREGKGVVGGWGLKSDLSRQAEGESHTALPTMKPKKPSIAFAFE